MADTNGTFQVMNLPYPWTEEQMKSHLNTSSVITFERVTLCNIL